MRKSTFCSKTKLTKLNTDLGLPPEEGNTNGWITLLATAGLPRVGSLGFSDNYLNDARPPPAYNFDENSQTSMSFGGLRFRLTQKTGSADNEVEVPAERKKIYWDIWGKPQRTAIVNMTPLRFDFHFTCNWSIFPHQALRPTNRIGL